MASSALNLAEVNTNSLALAKPTTLDNLYVPPAPGIMARAHSGKPKIDDSEATLKSQAKAISSPPPKAAPSIEAIVGKGSLEN